MKFSIVSLLLVLSMSAFGQQKFDDDVKSVDNIIKALYDVISGDADQGRDWERFLNLFTADARLIPTFKNQEGQFGYRTMTPKDYTEMFSSRIKTGFHEQELYRVTEEFGTIVHVFSTYETREKKNGPATARGINSIQLLKGNDRYYVMNIFWCAENLGFELPAKYLPKK